MLRFHIPRPRRGDNTLLPAGLAALLAAALLLQLALVRSDDSNLETDFALARSSPVSLQPIAAVAAEPVISERPIFAPARSEGAGGSEADPLGGAQVSGSWSVGRQVNLVLRQPDGATTTVHVGQAVNQWVLASVTSDGARFWRDGKTITVPFGAAARSAAASEADSKEEESQ
jgi:hypothetical protein